MLLERDFPPDLRVENEIKSLIKAGHSVVLACYSLKTDTSEYNWEGCKIYKKNISKFIYKSSIGILKFPFYFHFWRKHVERIIKIEKPNAIHIHDLPLAKIGAEFKKKYNLRFVLDLHENWPAYLNVSEHTKGFLGRLLSSEEQWNNYEKKMINAADYVITVVDEAKDRLLKLENKSQIVVVSNYPDMNDFDEIILKQKEDNKLILFYGGGINKHRGLQYVIQALPAIIKSFQDIELWIFGDGSYKPELEILSKDLNIEPYVKFFGNRPYTEMIQYLSMADVTLIPHFKSEHTDSTIPHKLFQYMYMGKFIMSSNCIPIIRIIEETNAGIIYTFDSPADFSKKFLQYVNGEIKFNKDEIRNFIKQKYNWEIESKKLLEIYNS